MKIGELIKELQELGKNTEVYISPPDYDEHGHYEELFSLADVAEYEEKELAEDFDGNIWDMEDDELDTTKIQRKFNAIVFYPLNF